MRSTKRRNPIKKLSLEMLAREVGLFVYTWHPGDGVTRYRFFNQPADYHSSGRLFVALGRKEALAFIAGWAAHREHSLY